MILNSLTGSLQGVACCFVLCSFALSAFRFQVGVISTIIPDPDHPEFSVFWLRDGCLTCHPWLNELIVFNDTSLRPQVDDVVHALTRTQQVVSLAGDIFTGGIEEAVFDLHLNRILDPATRIGSPAAGMSIF
jgi:glucoamylase